MAKLHIKTLRGLTAADAGSTIYDVGSLVGKVNLTAKGTVRVAFSYRYSLAGRYRDFGCGSWPTAELALIRKARNEAAELVRTGVDPIDARAAKKAGDKARQEAEKAKAKPLTVRGLFDLWAKAELQDRKDKGAEPLRALTRDIFPTLGNQPAAYVTKGKYLEQLDSIKKRAKAQANTVLSVLTRMYAWGVKRELVPTNPLEDTTRRDVGGAGGERDRVLTEDELRALHTALTAAALPAAIRHGLMAVLGTAARSGELLKARKDAISISYDAAGNPSGGRWDIPAAHSKNKKPHAVMLSPWAAWHMDRLLKLAGASPWLMPDARNPLEPVHGRTLVNATADRQLRFYERQTDGRSLNYAHTLEIGTERWTPHDLRRTAATLMGEHGIPADVIDKVLNHIERNKVRRTYQRQVLASQQAEAWRVLGELLQELMPLPEANIDPAGHFQADMV